MWAPGRSIRRRALLLCALCGSLALGALAQEPTAEAGTDPIAALAAQRNALAEEITSLERRVAEAPGSEAAERVQALESLDVLFARQLELLSGEQDLARREAIGEERLASGPEGLLANPPPYLIAVLDALADARDAQRQGTTRLESALEAARQAADATEESLDEAERVRRRDAEAADVAKNEEDAAQLRRALRRSELTSRTARAQRDLAVVELSSLERKLALQQADVRLLDDTVRWVRENVEVDPGAAEAMRKQLGDREFEAQRWREEAERNSATAEKRLAEAERRLEADPSSPIRTAELDARRAELRLAQRRTEFATAALARVERQKQLDDRRLRSLGGDVPRSELLAWQEELTKDRAETERSQRLLEVRRSDLETEIAKARGTRGAAEPGARRWIDRRVAALEAILPLYGEAGAGVTAVDTLAGRVLGELSERTARPSVADRFEDFSRGASAAWQFELFAAEDRPITVGKLVTGLLLFVLGFVVARLASRLLGRLLERRAGLATGAASAIQGLAFYVLLVFFFLIALRSVNIPLTAFTVLGGALAIGVGFGSQNIVNNFISGLILLAERPIKVGDTIEVDGQRGTVEWIGARSTRVRTFDNIHIIVPNSVFLETNVINWTLSDSDVRSRVDVGVAYGSPTREVETLLRSAIEGHEKILTHPEPLVLFRDFAADALLFSTHFWIRSRNISDRLSIESEIRHKIDQIFREEGITIAFPQRDVHLDAAEPLPVRMVGAETDRG